MDLRDYEKNKLKFQIQAEGNEYEAYLIEEFKHKFKIILRRGNRQPDKLTYLALDKEAKLPLMRLDVVPDNHAHKNPDGEIIYGTHLHIFTEQYQDKYATSLISMILTW